LRFKGDGAEIGKAGVQSGPVIKGFDVVKDGAASLGEGGEALVVDHFVFETAPEGFDEGVVVAVSFAAHGSDEPMLGQDLPVSDAGKLNSASHKHSQIYGASAPASFRPNLQRTNWKQSLSRLFLRRNTSKAQIVTGKDGNK
jgi:hypothetical protein